MRDVIIGCVHRRKVALAVAAVVILSACTSSRKPPLPLPINPTPAAAGQVVVLAGNGEKGKPGGSPPDDGLYATRVPLNIQGQIVTLAGGSLLAAVESKYATGAVQIRTDGRIYGRGVGGPATMVWLRIGQRLWNLVPGEAVTFDKTARLLLSEMTLSSSVWPHLGDGQEGVIFPPYGVEVDARGKTVHRLSDPPGWNAQLLALRGNRPVAVQANGRLYEVTGPDEVRAWHPDGYDQALREAQRAGFAPQAVAADAKGGFYLVGGGAAIAVPVTGRTRRLRLDIGNAPVGGWASAVVLPGGRVLLSARNRPRLTEFDAATGHAVDLPLGDGADCAAGDSLAGWSPKRIAALTLRTDGTVAATDPGCDQVIGFRPPTL
jgi:hypothetical protein